MNPTHSDIILAVSGVNKRFGGLQALAEVGIEIHRGQIYGLIGPNGAGKTTFFNLISGHVRPDEGRVLFDGADIVGLSSLEVVRRGMARAFQVASLFPSLTVREALTAAVVSHLRASGRVLSRFPVAAAGRRADEIMDLLGLDPKAGPGQNYDSIRNEEAENYYFHFPDGNASVARLLVRRGDSQRFVALRFS